MISDGRNTVVNTGDTASFFNNVRRFKSIQSFLEINKKTSYYYILIKKH